MLWLAPARLRGGMKLEAYHQSRQPQPCSLCGPWCFGTSVRSTSDVAASFSCALLRQPYLRPRRCGDLGFVSRHKPAEHPTPDVPAAPDVEASCITSCRGRRVSFSERRCGVTVCLQLRRSQLVLPLRPWYTRMRRYDRDIIGGEMGTYFGFCRTYRFSPRAPRGMCPPHLVFHSGTKSSF